MHVANAPWTIITSLKKNDYQLSLYFHLMYLYRKLHSNSIFSPDPYTANDNRIWAWSKMGCELHIITHINSHLVLNIICAMHFGYWCSYKMSFPSGSAGSKLQLFLPSGLGLDALLLKTFIHKEFTEPYRLHTKLFNFGQQNVQAFSCWFA